MNHLSQDNRESQEETAFCLHCGGPMPNGATKFCSHKCRYSHQRGSGNPRWKGIGARTIGSKGYIAVTANGAKTYEHVVIAEAALGKPLPVGSEIHHVDFDRANNSGSNLVICDSRSYHRLLHYRQKIVNAGGDPNQHKICERCKAVLEYSEFHKSKSGRSGIARLCKKCVSVRDKGRWRAKNTRVG